MESLKKLSIQVGLNGLSFCIIDSVNAKVIDLDSCFFEVGQTPYLIRKALKSLLEKHNLIGKRFAEVIVAHRTKQFALVPKSLFNKNNLPDYLKFNASISPNEKIVYDDLGSLELINVYAPFVKINDFIFEVFGEFRFLHTATTFLKTFLKQNPEMGNHCFVHVLEHEMDLLIVQDKKFALYNQYDIGTKEDFLYHILFSFEQLGINTDDVKLRLLGGTKENDKFLALAKDYIKDVAPINGINPSLEISGFEQNSFDFTVLNSF